MKFIKRLFCKHKYKYLGVGRAGDYDFSEDDCWSVFICENCGKIKLDDKHKVINGFTKGVPITHELIHKHYKNKSLKY